MFSGRKLQTIFIGGGTPSLAPPAVIKAVIDSASNYCGLHDDVEISMEANPGTADADNFRAYREAGINRLSMGVQSFDPIELRWLERIHSADDAIKAFKIARLAGFDNINLDLMYGLPKQSLSEWLNSLQTAIKLQPEHLSCYQLTVEPHTKLAVTHQQTPYVLPDDDTSLSMFFETRKTLFNAGYEAYEISNFAQPGLKCRHNDGYWLYHDYIGIGAGASGKWNHQDSSITRYSNIRTPERYIETTLQHGKAMNSEETLNGKQAAAEAFWIGLRRTDGINRSIFKQRFHIDPWQLFSGELQAWHDNDQLALTDDAIYLTDKGLALADEISACVL